MNQFGRKGVIRRNMMQLKLRRSIKVRVKYNYCLAGIALYNAGNFTRTKQLIKHTLEYYFLGFVFPLFSPIHLHDRVYTFELVDDPRDSSKDSRKMLLLLNKRKPTNQLGNESLILNDYNILAINFPKLFLVLFNTYPIIYLHIHTQDIR